LVIFTLLTTFRRACDAARLTHGQALPLMVFRLAVNAKMALSGALNSTLGRKRYAIRTHGDAVNWLLSKNASHATMANAYPKTITTKQQDKEAPKAFGHRVEAQCDLLNGLFNIQDVKDVFITGLSDLVYAHVRVLKDQFPDRTLSETVATAQLYWDGTHASPSYPVRSPQTLRKPSSDPLKGPSENPPQTPSKGPRKTFLRHPQRTLGKPSPQGPGGQSQRRTAEASNTALSRGGGTVLRDTLAAPRGQGRGVT